MVMIPMTKSSAHQRCHFQLPIGARSLLAMSQSQPNPRHCVQIQKAYQSSHSVRRLYRGGLTVLGQGLLGQTENCALPLVDLLCFSPPAFGRQPVLKFQLSHLNVRTRKYLHHHRRFRRQQLTCLQERTVSTYKSSVIMNARSIQLHPSHRGFLHTQLRRAVKAYTKTQYSISFRHLYVFQSDSHLQEFVNQNCQAREKGGAGVKRDAGQYARESGGSG
jgi:hypothetical protein